MIGTPSGDSVFRVVPTPAILHLSAPTDFGFRRVRKIAINDC